MPRAEPSSNQQEHDITVLCVASTTGFAELMSLCLERASSQLTTVSATNSTDALELLAEQEIDCLISAYQLAYTDGIVFLEAVRAEYPELPFILFVSRGSEQVASEAISAGVTDYVEQETGTDQYDRLATLVSSAVDRYRAHDSTASSTQQIERVLDTASDPIFVTVDSTCVYANNAATALVDDSVRDRTLAEFLDISPDLVRAVEAGESTALQRQTTLGSTAVTVTAHNIEWESHQAAAYVCAEPTERTEGAKSREVLLEAVFEAAPDGVVVVGTDGRTIAYNEQFATLWGIDQEVLDAGGVELLKTVLADAAEQTEPFAEQFASRLAAKTARRDEIALESGGMLEQYAVPLETTDGETIGTALYYRNISESVQVTQAQEPVFDRMTDAIFALDEDWEFTYVNEHAAELTDRSRSDLLGATLWNEFPELVGSDLEGEYRRAVERNEPFTTETYYEPLDRHLEIRLFPSETGVTIYFRDITHEHDIKTELRKTVEELEGLYQLAADQEQSFETKRNRMLRLGVEYLDLPYGFVTKIGESEQSIIDSVGDHELLQPGEVCPLEQSYCRKTVMSESGFLSVQDAITAGWEGDVAYETFELGTYIGAKLLVNGELYGTLCFAATEPKERDFTDSERTIVEVMAKWLSYEYGQRAYQQQLEEQNAKLERFASMVSHDLRNPLNVAMTRLELTQDTVDSEHLNAVDDAHERMQDLIEDILLLARQDGTIDQRTDLNLGSVTQQAWETVATSGAELAVVDDRVISGDESWLLQLFENLFRNSVEHGSTGNRTQSGDSVEHGSTSPDSQTRQDSVEHGGPEDSSDGLTVTVGRIDDGFYVEDDGVGIPADEQDRIFTEGFSGSADGTGLGLNIVTEIVDAHGWEISVTDSAAGGARFEITGLDSA